jgi:hypothetical protein
MLHHNGRVCAIAVLDTHRVGDTGAAGSVDVNVRAPVILRVPEQRGHPFAAGASRPVRVRVVG